MGGQKLNLYLVGHMIPPGKVPDAHLQVLKSTIVTFIISFQEFRTKLVSRFPSCLNFDQGIL
jgi:hypothetical protein